MKLQLATAGVLGVLIWSLLAVNVTPKNIKSETYRNPPGVPARYTVPERERAFVKKVRERMEKIGVIGFAVPDEKRHMSYEP